MKKLLSLVLIVVLLGSFAFSAMAGGRSDCPYDRECYIDQGCAYDPDTNLYYCWYNRCCREQIFEKGECFWTDWECASLIP
jgi:hypothetical protein